MCATVSPSHCGVDVCVDEDVLNNAPHCPHGPTLLFERYTPGKDTSQRYYACSACRDRKDCGFFQLHTNAEIISDFKKQMREEYNRSRQPWKRQEDFYQRFITTESLDENERMFCYDCQLLVLPDELPTHRKHRTKKGIMQTDLARPSYLMEAIENNKTNAQYLFSTKSVKFLVQTLKNLGFKRVLCVGVPRLHEVIIQNSSSGLESLLLDIDHRFGQFYPPSQFCRYNMFNHYFLDGPTSQERCREFLRRDDGEGVVMVTDPPFGGMVDALASGVRWIMEMWRSNVTHVRRALPVMWIFPYFLEHRIKESIEGLKMLDYKVDYDNHPLFKGGPDGKKKGSPVRIFTNLDPAKIELPTSEGYRFCKECHRYVAAENVHCSKCQECPSKNGTTYVHCEICNKCVKPWKLPEWKLGKVLMKWGPRPTLLFERYTRKDTSQRYYACCCRDRKDWNFQLHTNAEIIWDFKNPDERNNRSRQPEAQEDFTRDSSQRGLDENERMFCYDCQLLFSTR
nr:rRNA N6-adenosine-methyltransferase ZCCHC4-like [Lytechinus pictus]